MEAEPRESKARTRVWLTLGIVSTLTLLAVSVLAIAGVILSRVETISGERGGTLRAAMIDPVGDLDPSRVQTAFGVSLLRATVRTPYAFEPLRGTVPDLALGPPQISNESRRLEIVLRGGVHFAPPVDREVTADDIAYAIERSFLPGVNSEFAKLYFRGIEGRHAFRAGRSDRISGLRTPNVHTLVITLNQPTARVVAEALSLPIAAPVPRRYASRFDRGRRSSYARHLVATGPYRFAPTANGLLPGASARRLSMVRNPNWDAGNDFRAAFVDRIAVVPAPGVGRAEYHVLRGDDTISGDFAASAGILRSALKRRPEQVRLTHAGSIRYVTLNTRSPPLDNVHVRRAVTAAFDREAVRQALGGAVSGTIATHWIPPGVPGFEEAGGDRGFNFGFLSHPDGDVHVARSAMQAAGYSSGRYRGRAELVAVGSRERHGRRVAAVVRQAFRRVGIPLRVRLLGPRRALARCSNPQKTPDVCLSGGWVKDFDDAQTILEPLFSGREILSGGNANWSLFDSAIANREIHTATVTTGQADRAQAWSRADRTITGLAPAIPILWGHYPLLRSADVKGVVDEELGQWDLSFTSLR